MHGWAKIKQACEYAGIKERTFRDWLQNGLKHSRLPSGRILVRFSDIDKYLEKFQVSQNEVDQAVNQMLSSMGRSR